MNRSTKITNIKDFFSRPSFRSEDAEKRGVSRPLLQHYVRSGQIERIGPGIFCAPNTEIVDDPSCERMIRLTYAIPESVVCLVSALTLYELTDRIERQLWLAVPHSKFAPRIDGVRFTRFRNMDVGLSSFKIEKYKIPVFDLERTLIDSFRLLDRESAIKALQLAARKEPLNVRKLSGYAKKLRFNITPYLLMVTT